MDTVERTNVEKQKKWIKDAKVGEGAYAVVYQGREAGTDKRVAIKKIKVGQFKDGLDMSAIREVKYLKELKHQNVIALYDVFSSKKNLNLVLEFLDADLELIIRDRSIVFLPADIKSWLAMTFRGLEFCHRNWILHRDLKPNNLLIASDGQLKIADFGLARDFADPGYKMTCQVITRWYRPPELLYGCRYYSSAVDIWSVGCIFAELMLRIPYLPGETDMDQLKTTFRALGTPTEEEWPGHTKLPDYVPVGQFPKPPLRDLFTAASTEALNLLARCLTYDPKKRVTAKEGLAHPYFFAHPYPTMPSKLPKTAKQIAEAAAAAAGANGDSGTQRKEEEEDDLFGGGGGGGKIRIKAKTKKEGLGPKVGSLGSDDELDLKNDLPPTLSDRRVNGDNTSVNGNGTLANRKRKASVAIPIEADARSSIARRLDFTNLIKSP